MTRRPALVVLVIVLARTALADPSPEAMRLYRDGQAAYDQAHYQDALVAWQQSYELSRAPALLYNIAQAYRLRADPGDCANARERYRQFVQLTEPSPQRSLAERYVAELATCASAPVAVEQPPAEAPDDREHTIRTRTLAAVAIGGGGLVLLVTGLGLGQHASSLGDDVTNACATSCDWSVEKLKEATGHTDTTIGRTLDVLGVAALLGSGALYWFGIRDSELHVAPVATRSHESGAAISWTTAW